ncbi:hypothetical protein LX87_04376 [Larkinella arboricola]|uniref:Lipoprotein n=1 Tax=Larkinella arboricola TaxID=643671 RepID=A0A327WR64_LARAB|nr:hypothetical protein [Larkinella arboricola]RAJ94489.1 hypothetical protein LX87_04376 [Larkinella arboricola]
MKPFQLHSTIRFCCTLLLVAALFFLHACQTHTEPQAPGYDYFPLEAGSYRIYDVTEQRFALNGTPTTQTYQLREVTTDSQTDPANGTAFRIERYRRANEQASWQPDSVSSVRLSDDQLLRTENNVVYLKLVFPLTDQLQWNGNAYNTLGEDNYQLRHTGKSFNILNQTFPQTATVIQQNDSTLVNQDKRLEVYARNVGLIYREKVQLQFCSSTPSCVGKAQIDYGIRYYMRLRSYGKL